MFHAFLGDDFAFLVGGQLVDNILGRLWLLRYLSGTQLAEESHILVRRLGSTTERINASRYLMMDVGSTWRLMTTGLLHNTCLDHINIMSRRNSKQWLTKS